jgi:hypothetical protein
MLIVEMSASFGAENRAASLHDALAPSPCPGLERLSDVVGQVKWPLLVRERGIDRNFSDYGAILLRSRLPPGFGLFRQAVVGQPREQTQDTEECTHDFSPHEATGAT